MKAHQTYEKVVLPNGTRLMLIPMEGVESVATSVMVAVGSRYETTKINGLSHFLEHMVFKGTKKYPTTDDVNFIERMGGLQNAYTDIDITNYHNKVVSADWREALEINKELALFPRLEQKHVDRERSVILEEMKRYEDEPAIKVGETFHMMMYPGAALGMPVIGTPEALNASDATTLRTYHDRWYVPHRTVVVLAGNIKDERLKIKDQTTEWFGSLENLGSTEECEPVTESQTEPKIEIVTKPDAQQAHLTLGVRLFSRESPDRFAWSVFNLLFGVSFTSRLFREIREKKGLCYAIRSSADTFADVGYWSIYAGVATDRVSEAVGGIVEELKKVVDAGVTEEEIKIAKKRLTTMVTFKSEDPEFMNEWYGRQELYHQELLTLPEYLEKINAVTRDEVNTLVRKYILEKHMNLAVVWKKEGDQNLKKLLKI